MTIKENQIMDCMNEHLAHYQANYKNDWGGSKWNRQ